LSEWGNCLAHITDAGPVLLIHPDYFIRFPTASTIAASSGNLPVANFEYNRSPSAVSSKQPPFAGISRSSLMSILYVSSNLALKLSAFGS
jgi:hypothetical protein